METGEKIVKARNLRMLTQSQLAEKLGICGAGISQYERGIRTPKLSTIVEIANALCCSPMDLLPDSFLEECKEFEKENNHA